MELKPRIKGIFLVIISAMLWGVSGTFAQYLFQDKGFSPEWLVEIRLLSSGIILLLYAFMKGNQDMWTMWRSKRTILSLIFLVL
ncbi:drug/metabolite transporter (DMT)-like permease [Clostridium saccharobutylicum]|nr:drug/metabolite transporter (DMT)-like permease [Clostridium saccharobutylicum]